VPSLFEIDGNRITCSGGISALDMMVALIERDHGRPLAAGDHLERGKGNGKAGNRVPKDLIPTYSSDIELRVILGPQHDYFADDIEKFISSTFKVSGAPTVPASSPWSG